MSTQIVEAVLNQNSIYDWYSYVEDFPGRFVYEMLNRFDVTSDQKVLDPFVGHGTSLVTCKLLGIESVGVDLNPFCCFASRVKTNWEIDTSILESKANSILDNLLPRLTSFGNRRILKTNIETTDLEPPKMPGLDRWMSPLVVRKVMKVKHEILLQTEKSPIQDFLLFALASILRDISNVTLALNVTLRKKKDDAPVYQKFAQRLCTMIKDYKTVAGINSECKPRIFERDTRYLDLDEKFDFVITSPPYPNDIDYVNQTRMELFFLDLINRKEFSELKKEMITSDAIYYVWAKNKSELVMDDLEIMKVVSKLKEAYKDKNWGWDYPKMVSEYFGDMLLCLERLNELMKPGGQCVLVVGDAALKKVLVPADVLVQRLAQRVGFKSSKVEVLRKRRATSHKIPLRESAVIIKK